MGRVRSASILFRANHSNSLGSLDALRSASPTSFAGALLTADGRNELKRQARERGYRLLTKPVKPASLRAFLAAHQPRM